MFILFPHVVFHRITDIPFDFFKEKGINTLILDVDNTLTTHDNPVPAEGVIQWLRGAEKEGLKLIILSNNSEERVIPFAELLSLDFEAHGRKPLPEGFNRVMKKLDKKPSECCLIGDQLFTDVLGGRLSGIYCILVDYMEIEKTNFFRFKRALERFFMRFYKHERLS